jgi:hypothetical protein
VAPRKRKAQTTAEPEAAANGAFDPGMLADDHPLVVALRDTGVLYTPTDRTPNENYTFGGVYQQLPTPETERNIMRAVGIEAAWDVIIGTASAPTLSSLAPTSAPAGGADFTLHCIGTGFTPRSVIVFGGVAEQTAQLSPTELTLAVSGHMFPSPDPAVPVLVRTGPPGGGDSATLPFAFTPVGTAAFVTLMEINTSQQCVRMEQKLPGSAGNSHMLAVEYVSAGIVAIKHYADQAQTQLLEDAGQFSTAQEIVDYAWQTLVATLTRNPTDEVFPSSYGFAGGSDT